MDTWPVTQYEEFEPEPRKGWSPGVVALIATLVLALALGGAYFGVRLSNSAANPTPPPTQAGSFPTAGPTAPAASPTPAADPTTAAPTSAPPSTGPTAGFPLPDVYGLDFRAARTQLRGLGLGVNLVFTATGEGDFTVSNTIPARNVPVTKGRSITVYVPASAPETTVPGLIGLDCGAVGRALGDNGLFPEYVTGRKGTVTQQVPTSTPATPAHWNDKVKVWCATP